MMQIRLAVSITLFSPVGNGKLKNALKTVKLIETAITKNQIFASETSLSITTQLNTKHPVGAN